MAGAKEIRRQIQSIKKTQKITRAMEMVSASKVRKAQDRMLQTRPYAEKIREVISHLGEAHPEYKHHFLQVRELKRVGYIVISSDRGLCGGLNQGLFRKLAQEFKNWLQRGVTVELCVVGAKASQFFKRYGGNIVAQVTHLGDAPALQQLIGVVNILFKQFEEGQLDAVYVAYNEFVNTMQQKPMLKTLLPIVPEVSDTTVTANGTKHWDYIYEVDAKELISQLLKRFIESSVYQSLVENIASEHAARMVAMKNATDNAGELINKLNLVYNKARQAAITKELAEIVAGAEAV